MVVFGSIGAVEGGFCAYFWAFFVMWVVGGVFWVFG